MSETSEPGAPAAAPDPKVERSPRTRHRTVAPWWVPDARTWVAVGIFALAFYCLHLLATKPQLGDNKLFFAVTTGLFGGAGLLAVIGYFFIASKKDRSGGGGQ